MACKYPLIKNVQGSRLTQPGQKLQKTLACLQLRLSCYIFIPSYIKTGDPEIIWDGDSPTSKKTRPLARDQRQVIQE